MLKRIFIFCLFILFSMSINLLAEEDEEADLDYILEQIRLAQKNITIPDDVICTNIRTIQMLNKEGEVDGEEITEKRIYRKGTDKYYEEYISISEDGEELSEEEVEKERKKAMEKRMKKEKKKKKEKSENAKTEKFAMFDEEMSDMYTFTLVGDDTFNDIPVWVIEFKANEEKEEYANGNAFISKETYNILRTEISPAKNPSKIKEMSSIVTFNEIDGYLVKGQIEMNARIGFLLIINKNITVIDTYSDYQFNTGLEDSFFEEKEKESE